MSRGGRAHGKNRTHSSVEQASQGRVSIKCLSTNHIFYFGNSQVISQGLLRNNILLSVFYF